MDKTYTTTTIRISRVRDKRLEKEMKEISSNSKSHMINFCVEHAFSYMDGNPPPLIIEVLAERRRMRRMKESSGEG